MPEEKINIKIEVENSRIQKLFVTGERYPFSLFPNTQKNTQKNKLVFSLQNDERKYLIVDADGELCLPTIELYLRSAIGKQKVISEDEMRKLVPDTLKRISEHYKMLRKEYPENYEGNYTSSL